MPTTDLVTGAFGYTGSRIAERLLDDGRQVRTLTRRAAPSTDHPLSGRIETVAAAFDDATLERALAGVDTVYVTYWMRFPRGRATWDEMVSNVGRLVAAARRHGVRRLIYISVSNARSDSSTAYFRAKAAAEEHVRAASSDSMSSAIVRPTLLYGPSDILINNMAWTLRRSPVFGIPGDGRYLASRSTWTTSPTSACAWADPPIQSRPTPVARKRSRSTSWSAWCGARCAAGRCSSTCPSQWCWAPPN